MITVRRVPIPQTEDASAFSLDSSGAADSPWDRWSYRPGPATRILQCDATCTTVLRNADGEEKRWSDPLAAIEWLGDQYHTEEASDGPPFKGGWIGNLSYDLGRLFENILGHAADDMRLPLFTFTYHDQVIAIDHQARGAYECRVSSDGRDALEFRSAYGTAFDAPQANFTRGEYEAAVRRAIDYIGAGDIFQVNLAQQFSAGLPASPAVLYETLRRNFPAWFGALLDYGDHALLCNSPELFLRVAPQEDERHVLTRPIKGTRPRQSGLDDVLRRSAKDTAELNMIIDLERNDLGRICKTGSVRVTQPRVIEAHPTVFHGAATIEGMLRKEIGLVDLLRATFPGGSVTGAPKIRAMEIIEELEPVRRGPYCGAIGYLSADGHMQFNIAIRTLIAKGDRAYFSVGGGIVADSDPAAEYEETLVKARAMMETLASR